MKKIAYILLLYLPLFCYSQKSGNEYSSWNSLILDYHINDHFYIKNEAHFRRTNYLSNWQQILIRPSIHYQLNNEVDLATGYSYARNYNSAKDFDENNLWQQVLLSHKSSILKFKHRFRYEERFIEQVQLVSPGIYHSNGIHFSTRFRYRFTFSLPLLKVTDHKKIGFTAFDEIWLNTDKGIVPKSLNQNWLYAGLTYPILKKGKLGIGFMSDYTTLTDATHKTNTILQTTLNYHIN
ncbi:DUF2490 domain-containing protein [Aquimarina sp. 2201CG5-10]|uniref:DUF2490 domain-containing protein n=1 Tax=Aquimarina callyspongiae TaxID=3098150 RepID=UPI002AB4989E|nr:DUF2490 domain-containing protein [Aquimarina sp. 2201CG5-10]MDY8136148.1 DUF2490 domain-containing protein [Aquimarina sp. 2201CG5-10]